MKKTKKRYPNIIIYLCFIAWFFIIPLIIAIILCINNYLYDKEQKQLCLDTESKLKGYDSEYQRIINETNLKVKEKINFAQKECDKIIKSQKEELDLLNKAILKADSEYTYIITRFDIDEHITSEEYKNQYALLVLDEKSLNSEGRAYEILDNSQNKKMQNNDIKQLLRCFNSESASIISAVTVKNVETMRNKLMKSFDTINSIFKTDGIALTKDLLELKLKMLNVKYAQEYQQEQERLQQKAIREQMIEEEKLRKEIEREKIKIEKEENHFKNEIEKLMVRIQAASDIEKQLYVDKIRELEEKLKSVEESKKNVLEREQNTRAGYVYVISNIGSFGENVYKIGMTRRLDPIDRINELSSASVPFEFDVHAMIFSDDAPALETTLHNTFKDKRVNMVNPRKEFFRVSLDEIVDVVKQNFNATVEFTMVAKAEQFRETQRLLSNYTS